MHEGGCSSYARPSSQSASCSNGNEPWPRGALVVGAVLRIIEKLGWIFARFRSQLHFRRNIAVEVQAVSAEGAYPFLEHVSLTGPQPQMLR